MYIKDMNLINFRNYKNQYISLNKYVNVFVGDNAQGKTNIIEAIYMCSIGKSYRTSSDKELINWEAQEAYVDLKVIKHPIDKRIQLKIFKQGIKGVNINSIKVNKLSELIGVLNVIIFSPEDLKIIKESPSYRRRFLDIEISKIDGKYFYNLGQFKKVLSERNMVLKKIKDKELLDVYDTQLSEIGAYIVKKRIEYIDLINKMSQEIHGEITENREQIHFEYVTNIFKINENDENIIRDKMYKALVKNRVKDIEYRITSVGPHRDDFDIEINNVNTRVYGSQGQQRTAVLTLKFSSLKIIKSLTGEYPVLLLDDVLSELDVTRQKYILNSINDVQTIITCTGINSIREYVNLNNCAIFNVSSGNISKHC
ncbi:DNA replication and repair protein RecF [Hathewaya proteolytica DSM 3090]|uniref:DNA replication and repair protein RecF n=1 Tax=Hathewaya proteolytica DSM 3090 TaxID=1121331 RepID=A0A1M6MMQ3_9CLOT|nr:DNA replication/repair protein RecF [Hathewaya proteolytica]SHJ84729.1 DNA replication and repair protein RecF [Hathewaya proteolytica DSM 3090]